MCKLSSSDILTIRAASTCWEYFIDLVDYCIIIVKSIKNTYQFDLLKGTVLMLYSCSAHVLSKNCKIILQPNCRLHLPGTIL